MFIDPVCSIVFEAEASESDAMHQMPRSATEPLFTGARLYLSLLQGAVVLAAAFLLYVLALRSALGEDASRAVSFLTLVAGNVGLVLVNRSWCVSVIGTLMRRNIALWIAVIVTALVLAFLFVIPQVNELFSFVVPPFLWLVIAIAVGFSVTLWFDVLKVSGALKAAQ
jgi:Ca2+-transporting ATPase